MSLLDDFKARFPEIPSDKADELVPIYADIWHCYYGGSYDNACDREAILLLIAHMVVLDPGYSSGAGSGGNSKPSRNESSKTVGSVSVSYEASPQTGGDLSAWLRTTRYGQLFLAKSVGRSSVRVG
ncbi:head completion adaptor [Vibrio phage 1.052.A._10N.286.46.C3]|nr:head completion adaptor [Vibrio phage 1.052.A._10N.286.46.C3]